MDDFFISVDPADDNHRVSDAADLLPHILNYWADVKECMAARYKCPGILLICMVIFTANTQSNIICFRVQSVRLRD